MSDKNFVNSYLKDFSSLLQPNDDVVDKIISVRDILVNTKKNNTMVKKRWVNYYLWKV